MEEIEIRRILKHQTDYYAVLGVEKEATQQEIKSAFKKLAVKVHPDKNDCKGAKEAFQVLHTAFSALTDAQSRKEYDKRCVKTAKRQRKSKIRRRHRKQKKDKMRVYRKRRMNEEQLWEAAEVAMDIVAWLLHFL